VRLHRLINTVFDQVVVSAVCALLTYDWGLGPSQLPPSGFLGDMKSGVQRRSFVLFLCVNRLTLDYGPYGRVMLLRPYARRKVGILDLWLALPLCLHVYEAREYSLMAIYSKAPDS
jgi:hypothetical protein